MQEVPFFETVVLNNVYLKVKNLIFLHTFFSTTNTPWFKFKALVGCKCCYLDKRCRRDIHER